MPRLPFFIIISLGLLVATEAIANAEGPVLAIRKGPWIRYHYPLFGESDRPAHMRGRSQDYYWPADACETYPKFYGGFHARYYQQTGVPSGDIGLRGTAW